MWCHLALTVCILSATIHSRSNDRIHEELLLIQWYYWGFFLSPMIKNALHCIPIPSQLQLPDDPSLPGNMRVVFLAISSSCLLLDNRLLYHKWLTLTTKLDPIKLIFQCAQLCSTSTLNLQCIYIH